MRDSAVLGIDPSGVGARLDLTTGAVESVDQRVDRTFWMRRLLATDDALYYVQDHPGYFWDRVEVLHFDGRH